MRAPSCISAALLSLSGLLVSPCAHAQTVEQRLADYRQRVERLEDQIAIETLQADYGYYFDKGLWDEVADLFSKDGTFEYGQRGVYVGQDRIRRALLLFGPQGLAPAHLNNHMQLQAVITVAARRADAPRRAGRAWSCSPSRAPTGSGASGSTRTSTSSRAGSGKSPSCTSTMTAQTDYDLGWTKSAIPMEGQSALFPPDRPPSEVYRSYPGAYIPPFDYVPPGDRQVAQGHPAAGRRRGGEEVMRESHP